MPPSPPLADIRASHASAVVILSNDALLAARPATPVQLALACIAAGFSAAVPASWGDELVADATLASLSARKQRPAIHCACPHVARRVLAVGADLAPHLVSLVAPPVAAARYLRLHASQELRVTYVGRCPAAADDTIDARLTPEELLAQLEDRGIDVSTQPEVFESIIPPDRRRHLSLPGGLPSAEMLWTRTRCAITTMAGGEFAPQLASLVLAGTDTLIDPAPLVGCACAGTVRGEAGDPRAAVIALEPPRAPSMVVADGAALRLELELPVTVRTPVDVVADATTPPAPGAPQLLDGQARTLGDAPPPPPSVPNRRPRLTPPGMAAIPPGAAAPATNPAPRRRSPIGTPRVVPGSVPLGSDSEGRVLPRAYVAHRRSPRGGIRAVTELGTEPVAPPPAAAARAEEAGARGIVLAGSPAPAPQLEMNQSAVPGWHGQSRQAQALREGDPGSAARDSERPVARSVEPAANRTAPFAGADPALAVAPSTTSAARSASTSASTSAQREPVATVSEAPAVPAVRQPAAASAAARAFPSRVAELRTLSSRDPRTLVAVIAAAAGLLIAAAIGYSAARRHDEAPRASTVPAGQNVESITDAAAPRASGARESVSAGGIAPAQRSTRRATTRLRQPAPAGAVAGRARTTPIPAASPAPPDPASPASVGPAIVTAPPAAQPVPDSAVVRAQRDSAARIAALNAERESIRREIGLRRARVDSIERARIRLDSLGRAEPPGVRPRRR